MQTNFCQEAQIFSKRELCLNLVPVAMNETWSIEEHETTLRMREEGAFGFFVLFCFVFDRI